MDKEHFFMGGFLMAPFLFGMQQEKNVSPYSIIAIRFDPKVKIIPILEDVIKDAFFVGPSNYQIELELTKKAELRVFNKPKKGRAKPILAFTMIGRSWSKKDSFLIMGIRDQIGNPVIFNITLLRHLLIKLNEEQIKYEIW